MSVYIYVVMLSYVCLSVSVCVSCQRLLCAYHVPVSVPDPLFLAPHLLVYCVLVCMYVCMYACARARVCVVLATVVGVLVPDPMPEPPCLCRFTC
jgi:hypothetical protein